MRLYKISMRDKYNRVIMTEQREFATDGDAMAYALACVRCGECDNVVVYAL